MNFPSVPALSSIFNIYVYIRRYAGRRRQAAFPRARERHGIEATGPVTEREDNSEVKHWKHCQTPRGAVSPLWYTPRHPNPTHNLATMGTIRACHGAVPVGRHGLRASHSSLGDTVASLSDGSVGDTVAAGGGEGNLSSR